MNAPVPPRRGYPWKTAAAWIAGAVACGACCAGPLLGSLGAIAALSAAAAIWVPALAGLAVAAALTGYLIHRRRRTATTHRPGTVDLGLPGIPAPRTHKAPAADTPAAGSAPAHPT